MQQGRGGGMGDAFRRQLTVTRIVTPLGIGNGVVLFILFFLKIRE